MILCTTCKLLLTSHNNKNPFYLLNYFQDNRYQRFQLASKKGKKNLFSFTLELHDPRATIDSVTHYIYFKLIKAVRYIYSDIMENICIPLSDIHKLCVVSKRGWGRNTPIDAPQPRKRNNTLKTTSLENLIQPFFYVLSVVLKI